MTGDLGFAFKVRMTAISLSLGLDVGFSLKLFSFPYIVVQMQRPILLLNLIVLEL